MKKDELVTRLYYHENPCPVYLVWVEKNFTGLVYPGKVYVKKGRFRVYDDFDTLRGELIEYTIFGLIRRTWYKQLKEDVHGVWLQGETWFGNPLTECDIRPRLYLAKDPEEAEVIRWSVAGKLAKEYDDLLARRYELQDSFQRKLKAIDRKINELKRKV